MASSKKRSLSTSCPVDTNKPVAATLTGHPTPRLKHRRLHPEAISLYTGNAQTPFLGLPREIRDQIWTYLYGNLVVHPRERRDGRLARRTVHPLRFIICDALQTPKDLYELTLQGASSDPSIRNEDRAITWAAPELQSYHHMAIWQCIYGQSHLLGADELKVPIVCRQIWDEMSEMVYETCTFAFTKADDFLSFLSCRKAGLERVRRVLLAPEIGAPIFGRLGVSELKWWNLKRLKGVRSLDLWIVWQVGLDYKRFEAAEAQWLEKKGNGLGVHWKELQSMVDVFRRWNLRDQSTRVIVDVVGYMGEISPHVQRCMSVAERLQLARQIRGLLLKGRVDGTD